MTQTTSISHQSLHLEMPVPGVGLAVVDQRGAAIRLSQRRMTFLVLLYLKRVSDEECAKQSISVGWLPAKDTMDIQGLESLIWPSGAPYNSLYSLVHEVTSKFRAACGLDIVDHMRDVGYRLPQTLVISVSSDIVRWSRQRFGSLTPWQVHRAAAVS